MWPEQIEARTEGAGFFHISPLPAALVAEDRFQIARADPVAELLELLGVVRHAVVQVIRLRQERQPLDAPNAVPAQHAPERGEVAAVYIDLLVLVELHFDP